MGRYYFDAKTTVEQATQLSIFKLKEFGLLRGYSASTLTWTHKASGKQDSIGITVDIEDEPYVKVNYTITDRTTGEKTKYDYKISLTSTPCHFGGVRYWFICPLSVNGVYCGRGQERFTLHLVEITSDVGIAIICLIRAGMSRDLQDQVVCFTL